MFAQTPASKHLRTGTQQNATPASKQASAHWDPAECDTSKQAHWDTAENVTPGADQISRDQHIPSGVKSALV